MKRVSRATILRYGVAVLGIALATGLRRLLDPLLGDAFPFATLFLAILAVAGYAGFGPAVAATLLGIAASVWLLLSPSDRPVAHGYEQQAGLVLYTAVGLGIAALGGAMRAARQRAETEAVAAVLQREELRTTLASIGDAVLVTDAEGRVVSMNPVAEALTGWSHGEGTGEPLEKVFVIVNEQTRRTVECPVTKVLREGTVVGLANHTILIAKDGTERPIDDSAAPIRHDGRLTGVILVFRDVTERRRAEEAHRQLAAVVASSDDAIIVKDLDGTITSWNAGAERVYGYAAEEIIGKPFSVLVPPDRATEVRDSARRLQRGERLDHFETVRRRGDGTLIDVSVSYSPVKDEDGHLIGTAVITRDITSQKRAEDRLRESEERLRLALEAGRMGVWDWWIRTNEIKWSDNLEAVHGLAPGTFGGTLEAFQELIHPGDREAVNRAIARSLEEGSSYDIEFRNLWPDASVHWMSGKGRVFTGDDGRPARMIGVGMDITDRKRAERDTRFLAEASVTLAGLVDYESTLQKVAKLAVPHFADWVAVDVFDEDNTLRRLAVAHVDPAKVGLAHQLHHRFPPDPNAPQGIWNIIRTGRSEMIPEINDDLLVASVPDAELLGIMRELGLRSYMGVPLSVRGRVLGVITFIAAETGRRYDASDLAVAEDLAIRAAVAIENARLYHEVREAGRRKDEFLAVLGHELRNPLAPISNALQVLKTPGASDRVLAQSREMMERQVQHMVRLVDDLLDVSRIVRGKVDLRREPVELAAVVDRAVETSQPLVEAEGHELTVALPPEPLLVHGDLVRLGQVVGNLLNNAARYTERGGKIRVEAERVGDTAVLRVRDTGIGIPPEALPRIWDLFVQADRRTRAAQGGMGVGLALVKGLVELHGGSVGVRSEGAGRGSEFSVTLPLLPPPKPCEGTGPVADKQHAVPRRVLVVDDNVDAAESLAMLLELGRHQVRVAHDGPMALKLAEVDPPEVAFLDIGMPGMDGYELARRFRDRPALRGVRLVALTGWGQEEDRRRTKEAGFDHHLVKPVDLTAVEEILTDHSLPTP